MGFLDVFRRKDDDFSAQMMREAAASRPPDSRARAASRQATSPVAPAATRGFSGQDSSDHAGADPSAASAGITSAAGADATRAAITDAVLTQVRAGEVIEAIKLYRFATGVGLQEAKDAVDALAAGGMPTVALAPSPSTASAQPTITDAEVLHLAQAGRLIEAVKEYRTLHGVGLAEAKHAVDGMSGR